MWEKFAAWMGQNWWVILVAAALIAALVAVCVAASKARKKDGQKAESGGENASADAAAQRERGDAEGVATPVQTVENAVETEPAEAFEDDAYFVAEGEAASPEKRLPVYRVHYDRAGATWVVKKDGNERVTRRTATKAEALEAAKELCRRQDAALTVQKKDGKFQKRRNAK